MFWPLETNAPWWLFTRYLEANAAFTWLDGALILAYVGGVALALGGAVLVELTFAGHVAKLDWRALSLVPLAAVGTAWNLVFCV